MGAFVVGWDCGVGMGATVEAVELNGAEDELNDREDMCGLDRLGAAGERGGSGSSSSGDKGLDKLEAEADSYVR